MKKYVIDYISKYDDDLAHCWVYANSKKEAEMMAYSEYHDIKSIIQIYERA